MLFFFFPYSSDKRNLSTPFITIGNTHAHSHAHTYIYEVKKKKVIFNFNLHLIFLNMLHSKVLYCAFQLMYISALGS